MRKDYCDSCGDEISGDILNISARTATEIRGSGDFFLNMDVCKQCADIIKQAILNISKITRGLQGSAK